jgi:hypothetical protein
MTPFQDKVLKFLNKDYNKNTLTNYNFNFFRDIMFIANSSISDDLINRYGVDQNTTEFYDILRDWCRQNYGDGKYAIPGDTIRLIKMVDDPKPIPPNTIGIVREVQTISAFNEDHLIVEWENGRKLNLIVGLDEFERIKDSVK